AAIRRAGVAVVRARGSALGDDVRRTERGRSGAVLRDVALAGGGATHRGARLEAVGRTARRAARTRLGDVARSGARPAFGARRSERAGVRAARGRRAVRGPRVALLLVRRLHDAVAACAGGVGGVPALDARPIASVER